MCLLISIHISNYNLQLGGENKVKKNYLQKMFVVLTLIFVSIISAMSVQAQNMFRKVNDFDGDGKADFAVTRNQDGYKYWYIMQSAGGIRVFQWGLDFDQNASGDYDGDGKTDVSVMRLTVSGQIINYSYYIFRSSTSTYYFYQKDVVGFGSGIQVTRVYPQDYDGDGKTDIARYELYQSGGKITILQSSDNAEITFDVPMENLAQRLGDLTGDGKSDFITVNRNSFEVRTTDYATRNTRSRVFGASDDQYVPADFDGDGIGDLAIYRRSTGTWWWIRSSDNVVEAARWGEPTEPIPVLEDIPVPADYDGDGKTDLAIWRRGTYWILGSQNGVSVFNWGLSNDNPVRY